MIARALYLAALAWFLVACQGGEVRVVCEKGRVDLHIKGAPMTTKAVIDPALIETVCAESRR